jgi:hypothetical protein
LSTSDASGPSAAASKPRSGKLTVGLTSASDVDGFGPDVSTDETDAPLVEGGTTKPLSAVVAIASDITPSAHVAEASLPLASLPAIATPVELAPGFFVGCDGCDDRGGDAGGCTGWDVFD